MSKATKLSEVHRYFKASPLKVEELSAFYVEATEARGNHVTQRMIRSLQESEDENLHILFAGYKGCGKSTELSSLTQALQEDFLIVNFSILEELDPISLNYIELFIVAMERLFFVAQKEHLALNEEFLTSIQNWTQTEAIQEINQKYISGEVEVGAGINALTAFFGRFKAAAKASKSLKEVLSRTVEPKLSELIFHCNALIREIKTRLAAPIKKRKLLLIIEDLDKIPLDRSEDIFYNYSQQLTQLRVHTIFTFPITLFYNPKFNTIKHQFEQFDVLPMIKIRERGGEPSFRGVKVMREIVAKRMDLTLFEDLEFLDKMIHLSGGCLRDLFLMVKEAADSARDFNREKIAAFDFEQARLKLKREYDANIADKVIDGEVKVPVEKYFEALVALEKDESKSCEHSQVVMDLRQNLTILSYNGQGWCDVHPVVKEILEDRGKLSQ